jgi:hypothetical protein
MHVNLLCIVTTKVQLQTSLIYQCGENLANVFGPSHTRWSVTLTQTSLLQPLNIIDLKKKNSTLFLCTIYLTLLYLCGRLFAIDLHYLYVSGESEREHIGTRVGT